MIVEEPSERFLITHTTSLQTIKGLNPNHFIFSHIFISKALESFKRKTYSFSNFIKIKFSTIVCRYMLVIFSSCFPLFMAIIMDLDESRNIAEPLTCDEHI